MRHELRELVAQGTGGAIVNNSSWLATGGLPGSTIYSASKSGVDGLMRPAALEHAPHDIRINNIAPGGIATDMPERALGPGELMARFAAAHPGGRLGDPDEVAELAVWLCTDAASFITGQSIAVDGGYAIPGQRAS